MESLHRSTLLHPRAPCKGRSCCQLEKKSTNGELISPVQSRRFSLSQQKQMLSRNKPIQVFLKDANQNCHRRFPKAVSAKINDRFLDLARESQVAETKPQSDQYVKRYTDLESATHADKYPNSAFNDGINGNSHDNGNFSHEHSQSDVLRIEQRSQCNMHRVKNKIIPSAVSTISHSNNDVQHQDMKASVSAKSVHTKGELNETANALLEQLTSYSTVLHPLDLSHEFKLRSAYGQNGLGIVEFLRGKRILITGATGFLAKVLLEKILREQPDVGQLYLLINADSTEKAKERLVTEVQGSQLFQLMKSNWEKAFEEFMGQKVTPIVGDVTREDLGLEESMEKELAEKIDVIVNSAATTKFDERYDVAIDINTKGPIHLLEFGKKCTNLQLFLHISTAFVNGERSGCISEMPFQMNTSIRNEQHKGKSKTELNVKEEIALAEKMQESFNLQSAASQALNMKKLGFQRAKLHGWQDTYIFTKAMGEMLIGHERENIPVVIVRPSVVESTLMQPFSGWMEGIRMIDPIAIAYGKGLASAFLADPKGVLDVIPADMVVNATLAAMAKHARQPGLTVYQIGSSVVNPLIFERLVDLTYEHFRSHPFVDQNGVPIVTPKLRLFKDKISFRVFNYLNCELPGRLGRYLPWSKKNISEKRRSLFDSAAQQITHLIEIYSPYTFYKGRFDISNTKMLHSELSPAEKEAFGFEVSSIDWEHYMKNVHFPGLRKYVLRGRNITTRL
ncbi:hypothetical protein O6H91_05G088900 [Diphasiastrum complanatum]|uniref:Uncharacterized protein n=1 Tax=Diphasiastrum complanatum TaxID=34168 RepID=A0ACC2DQU7_DIPCM|nr:hypothetical protein O6H91_05G088900 [Diphasiastrum complanatum]